MSQMNSGICIRGFENSLSKLLSTFPSGPFSEAAEDRSIEGCTKTEDDGSGAMLGAVAGVLRVVGAVVSVDRAAVGVVVGAGWGGILSDEESDMGNGFI
jgi:hypothetical protein